jgi:superfamily II DNA or RNA helicase
MISRSGFIVPRDRDLEKALTVTPEVNTDYAPRGIPFKVFRRNKDNLCIPQHYGKQHIEADPRDKRPDPVAYEIPFSGKLRKDINQPEAVKKVLESMKKCGGGVLSLPCGFGKTVCAIKIASKLGVRTMIMVHKEFLANQWKQRIEQFCPGMTVGRIQQDKFEIEHPFVIGMLQTFTSRDFSMEAFESVGLVIVDEAHHICARVFSQSMLRMCPKYTLGLSATPVRKDGLTNVLYWFLGPQAYMVERKQDDEVTMDAIKPKLDIYYQPFPTSRFGKVSLAEATTMLVEDEERNKIILEKMKELGHRKVLILTDRRDHCFWLKENIPNSGLYIGGMKEADLDESATKMVIIGTFNMAHEGLDIGDVDTVFMVTPKSDVVQAVGRCMREGGSRRNPPKIIDLHDNWGPFDAMYYKRRKIYKQLGIIKDAPKKQVAEILEFLD